MNAYIMRIRGVILLHVEYICASCFGELQVPFLRLQKSPQERMRLGVMDRQTAVFVLPEQLGGEWEERWGGTAPRGPHDYLWMVIAIYIILIMVIVCM